MSGQGDGNGSESAEGGSREESEEGDGSMKGALRTWSRVLG